MTYTPRAGLGDVTVSGGFIPAECLVLIPNVGFQWLCGEPVHPDVIPLLATSNVPDPVVDTVVPSQDVVAPDGTVLQEADRPPTEAAFAAPAYAAPGEAGFGVLGLLATILAGLAISSSLSA